MTRCRRARPGTAVDSPNSHYPHKTTDMFPVDTMALTLQPGGYLAGSVERRSHVLMVNQFHKVEVLVRDSCRLVVQSRATDVQQLALTYH